MVLLKDETIDFTVEWTHDRFSFHPTQPPVIQAKPTPTVLVTADESSIAAMNNEGYTAVLRSALGAVDQLRNVLDMGGYDGCGMAGVLALQSGASFVYTVSDAQVSDEPLTAEERLLTFAKALLQAERRDCDFMCGGLGQIPLNREWNVAFVHPVSTCGLLKQDLAESALTALTMLSRNGSNGVLLPRALRILAAIVQWDGVSAYNSVDDRSTCGFRVSTAMAQFSVGTFLEVDPWGLSLKWLTDPLEIKTISLSEWQPQWTEESSVVVPTTGRADAVLFWFEMDFNVSAQSFRPELWLSTLRKSPAASLNPGHWMQAASVLAKPIELKTASLSVRLRATCSQGCLNFTVEQD